MSIARTLFFALAAAASLAACGKKEPDAYDVTVIGEDRPAIVDPAVGPLSVPDQVAMQAMAQGLVRFDARGEIEPGLAERWNVSDDGLSYIFRLGPGKWPDGREIRARDVVRLLNSQLRSSSRNELKDALGAVDVIVAMTDRVIEIRLTAPRPHLLQLLAQPEMALVRDGMGSGPYVRDDQRSADGVLAMTHHESIVDGPDIRERATLRSEAAGPAIERFVSGESELVLGGTFADLPLAQAAKLPRGALRFDPVAGLFGLAPAKKTGPFASVEARELLSRAIDRAALVEALKVPGLAPRETLLQSGLDGVTVTPPPARVVVEDEVRRAALAREGARLFGEEPPPIRLFVPEGPGGDLLFERLRTDWSALGLEVERAENRRGADIVLIDEIAPSGSPSWFVRRFRCERVPVCSPEADTLMDSARQALVAAQRAAFFSEAARRLDASAVFIPLTAPVRWSLVASRLEGFSENQAARHPLTGLDKKPSATAQ